MSKVHIIALGSLIKLLLFNTTNNDKTTQAWIRNISKGIKHKAFQKDLDKAVSLRQQIITLFKEEFKDELFSPIFAIKMMVQSIDEDMDKYFKLNTRKILQSADWKNKSRNVLILNNSKRLVRLIFEQINKSTDTELKLSGTDRIISNAEAEPIVCEFRNITAKLEKRVLFVSDKVLMKGLDYHIVSYEQKIIGLKVNPELDIEKLDIDFIYKLEEDFDSNTYLVQDELTIYLIDNNYDRPRLRSLNLLTGKEEVISFIDMPKSTSYHIERKNNIFNIWSIDDDNQYSEHMYEFFAAANILKFKRNKRVPYTDINDIDKRIVNRMKYIDPRITMIEKYKDATLYFVANKSYNPKIFIIFGDNKIRDMKVPWPKMKVGVSGSKLSTEIEKTRFTSLLNLKKILKTEFEKMNTVSA